jgi:hypothetical protein
MRSEKLSVVVWIFIICPSARQNSTTNVFVAGILAGLYNWLLEGGREGIWVASQKSIAGDGGFDKDIFLSRSANLR